MYLKKKLKKRFLTCLLVFCAVSIFSFNAYSQNLKGDVNNNGVTDINDALLIARYSAGLQPATFNINLAEVNCDGRVDIIDALAVARYAAQVLINLSCTYTPVCTGCTYPTPSPTVKPTCSSCAIKVNGIIVDNQTRLPLSDVTMQLDLITYGKSYFITTDSSGFFSYNNITTACDYEAIRLSASRPGYRACIITNGNIQCGSELNFQTFPLVPGSYTPTPIPTTPWPCMVILSGKVTSSLSGKPISGALVSSTSSVRTDERGNYSLVLQVPEKGLTLRANDLLNVQAAGYVDDTLPVTEFSCGGYAIDFRLNPIGSVGSGK